MNPLSELFDIGGWLPLLLAVAAARYIGVYVVLPVWRRVKR